MRDAVHALVAKLKEPDEPELSPASAEGPNRAQVAGFPDELIDFYRQWEPGTCVELKQQRGGIAGVWPLPSPLPQPP